MSDLLSLLRRVSEAGIEFVIVGGFAGIVHGCTYVTQDIDICCAFAPDTLLALQEALADMHPVHRMTPGRNPLELTAESAGRFANLHLSFIHITHCSEYGSHNPQSLNGSRRSNHVSPRISRARAILTPD